MPLEAGLLVAVCVLVQSEHWTGAEWYGRSRWRERCLSCPMSACGMRYNCLPWHGDPPRVLNIPSIRGTSNIWLDRTDLATLM